MKTIPAVPAIRIRSLTPWPIHGAGEFVLYWMTAFRRTRHNFALQRGVELAEKLRKPLVIFEALRCNYRWASDRFHQFIIEGMMDNARAVASTHAMYLAYVETKRNEGRGLMESLAQRACAVVSDDYPCFFHPTLYAKIASKWHCAVELVDSNTIIPMRQTDRTFTVAHSYRRYMQKELYGAVPPFPVAEPLLFLTRKPKLNIQEDLAERWPVWMDDSALKNLSRIEIAKLPIDHSVTRIPESGGAIAAGNVLKRFLEKRLDQYEVARNEPEQSGSSALSPYLHFGHISPHEIFSSLTEKLHWSPNALAKPNGKMNGFWNMGSNAEAFMDQLMTWREIGFNQCWREPRFDRYESLPVWAQKTLSDHESDPRPWIYSLEEFEAAQTHDPLWNAAQNQLVREGRMHNYLRMLWGKKILHWTPNARDALRIMIELNNKYALDGRDPNSYSGIFWVLGRFDRAWGPERPIFGKVRYMTSESTQNKFHVKRYIQMYA